MSRTPSPLARSDSQHGPRGSTPAADAVDSAPELISTVEAAKRLGVSAHAIRRYVAAGYITAVRIGPKLLRFDPREIDKLTHRIDNRTASA